MSRTDEEPLNSLADAVLAQNAAVGQLVRSIDRVLLQLQAATNAMEQAELNQHELRHELKVISERLAVISKDVDDVERAAREATGSFKRAAGGDSSKHAAVGVLRAFGALPRATQVLLVLLVVALAVSGWLAKLLH